jgi:hypothetical protein
MSTETIDEANTPTLTADLRAASNLLCLWGLCGKAACRRARACKHNAHDCLDRYAPLVPEEARFGAAAMLMGKRDGVSYDEVRRHAPAEIAAIESWIGLVHAAARAPLRTAQP